MTEYAIYHMPGTCSRVALVALEEAGIEYTDHTINLMQQAQYQEPFASINPKGKVPVLKVDEAVVTELPVILTILANDHPGAALLPSAPNGQPTVDSQSDLAWLAGSFQPLAVRMFLPQIFSNDDAEGVKALASAAVARHAADISTRLARTGWWHGNHWTICDTFVSWIFNLAAMGGFSLNAYPKLIDHQSRVESRASFQLALAREKAAAIRDSLTLRPGVTL